MTNTNPYAAPESELSPIQEGTDNTLQQGIDGDYQLTVGEVFTEAWELTKGFKARAWGAIGIIIGISILLNIAKTPFGASITAIIIFQLISMAISAPLNAGMAMLSIHRVAGRDVPSSHILGYYNRIVKIVLLNIVMILMILLGFVLLVIPGIYLCIAYVFALPLMLEKNLGIWEALEASRKAVTHKWFTIFAIYLLMMLIMLVAMLPLGIGLIWVVPMFVVVFGVVYKTIFGILPE